MDETTSPGLSPDELSLFSNPDIWIQKERIFTKVETLLLKVRDELLSHQAQSTPFPSPYVDASPRLTRGDNYQQMPYRVLDYPRFFDKADMLVFRTVILWGYPIGMHFILSGKARTRFRASIEKELARPQTPFYVSLHETPWYWEFPHADWAEPAAMSIPAMKREIDKRDFLKISQFVPMEESSILPKAAVNMYTLLGRICGSS